MVIPPTDTSIYKNEEFEKAIQNGKLEKYKVLYLNFLTVNSRIMLLELLLKRMKRLFSGQFKQDPNGI